MKAHAAIAAAIAGAVASGCVPRDAGYQDVRSVVAERTGGDVRWHEIDGASASAKAVRELLAAPLTADSAARIALLNNPEMQAAFEDLGVARAGLVARRRLPNPVAEASLGFGAHGRAPDIDVSVTEDLSDLLLLPMKSGVGTATLDAAKLDVAGAAMDLALEAKTGFYELSAATQALDLRRQVLLAARASLDVAEGIHEAGNLTDLDLASERALYQEARLAVARAEADVAASEEQFAAVLGVWGDGPRWKLEGRLAAPPERELPTAELERRAVERSIDLALTRRLYAAAARAANYERVRGFVPELAAGVGAEREDGEWQYGPVAELEIPLFYQGQGEVAAAEAEMRKHARRFAAQAIRIRAAARAAGMRLRAARDRALFHRDTLVPLRRKILDETQLAYNAMGVGVFQLLQAKRGDAEAGREYVEALRDYWIARAEAEQLLAGRLVRPSASAAPSAPTGSSRDVAGH